jgi:hypothetical protein
MPDDSSHEETDDPGYADRRNFYKIEKWSGNGECSTSKGAPECTPIFS